MIEDNKLSNYIAFATVSLIAGLYIWAIITYTSTMPIVDGYNAILTFLHEYIQSTSIEKFKLLFSQHNEHRIVLNRIVEVIQLSIFGEVNFLYLTLFGNLGWILTVYLLWYYSKKEGFIDILSFLPVVLFMFSFSHAALITWAMASIQQYWQILFSVMAIYSMTKGKVYVTIVFMVMAFFTGGGGIILIPITLLYYTLHKEWKNVFIVMFISMVMLIVYFVILDFQSNTIHRDFYSIIILHYTRFIKYIFTFVGNMGDTLNLSIALGALLTLLSLYHYKELFKKGTFLYWSIIFVFSIAFLAAMSRSEASAIQALSSRYATYSALLISLVYLQYYNMKQSIVVRNIGICIGIVFFTYYFMTAIPAFKERKYIAETRLAHPVTPIAEKILYKSKSLGIFSSWDEKKLPSKLLQLPYISNVVKATIKIEKNPVDKVLHILPSALNLAFNVEILNYGKDNQHNVYALIVLLDGRKQLFFPQCSSSLFTSNEFRNKIIGNLNISRLAVGEHTLAFRVINDNYSGYYALQSISLIKDPLDILLALPIKEQELKGWIDQFELHKNKIYIKGWYAQLDKALLSKTLLLDIDGKKYVTRYGYESVGVAEVLKNNAYKQAGFRLEIDKSEIGSGKHKVRVYVLSDKLDVLYKAKKSFDFEIK